VGQGARKTGEMKTAGGRVNSREKKSLKSYVGCIGRGFDLMLEDSGNKKAGKRPSGK